MMPDPYYRQLVDLLTKENHRLATELHAALSTKKASDAEIDKAKEYADRLEYLIGGNIDSPEERQLAQTIENTLKMG